MSRMFSTIGVGPPERPNISSGSHKKSKAFDLESWTLQNDLREIQVTGFVGPSGTGKSTKVWNIASERGISWIIDDGLLIWESRIMAGTTAKKASNKMEAVRTAIFDDPVKVHQVQRILVRYRPEHLLILGTSVRMVDRICENLNLGMPAEIIDIESVATPEEMDKAREVRQIQGKHTIPVPNIEIKHEFSGYLTESLGLLKKNFVRSKTEEPDRGNLENKTVVRPEFSSIGNYYIADEALAKMLQIGLADVPGFAGLVDYRITKEAYGIFVRLDLALYFGYQATEVLMLTQERAAWEIETYTTINVLGVDVAAVKLVADKGRAIQKELQDLGPLMAAPGGL